MKILFVLMILGTVAACTPDTQPASAGAPANIASNKTVLHWVDHPKPYEEPQEVALTTNDPEYWAVLDLMVHRGLTMDIDHEATRELLDYAEAKLRAIAKWSRTQSNVRVRSAWALWVNVSLRNIAESRIPANQAPIDPDRAAKEAAQTAARVMEVKLTQPPDIECARP